MLDRVVTLRSRLVAALVLLAAAGLVVFGVTTYALYQRSLQSRLDDQLRSATQPLGARLTSDLMGWPGFDGGGDAPSGPNGAGGFGFDTYAALIGADGEILASIDPGVSVSRPDLPAGLSGVTEPTYVTTGSVEGSGRWRLLVQPLAPLSNPSAAFSPPAELDDAVVVVAASTSELDAQMTRLLQIEVTAAVALLSALAVGAWLILRRGLRPLEHMAASARTISEGDLARRVEPSDRRTEVGQLGLALNTMLDRIETSFGERDATEARLRQFLADASHELRTPLTSIQGFAELFRLRDRSHDVDLPVIMRRIEEEADRMKVLVEDLLLLARLDETRPFEPQPVDLTVLAADACSDATAVAPHRRVTLDAPAPAVVLGEPDHLRQALGNLMANAIHHTPDGTPIEVSVHVGAGAVVQVSVRDHGPGVPEEAKPRVFDRFWQADTARVGVGNGLGLAIVAEIAEEHGGRVALADAPGGGACFTLELPGAVAS